jgi:ketosteroid isomerase-like protein
VTTVDVVRSYLAAFTGDPGGDSPGDPTGASGGDARVEGGGGDADRDRIARTADAIAAHVTDDFVNSHASALGSGCVGRDEYRRRLPDFLDRFTGLRYDDVDVIADGDRAAAAYRLRARYDGHDIDIAGVMVFELRDGRIASRTDVWDSLTFLRQIDRA